jgi:hypothetical protein
MVQSFMQKIVSPSCHAIDHCGKEFSLLIRPQLLVILGVSYIDYLDLSILSVFLFCLVA